MGWRRWGGVGGGAGLSRRRRARMSCSAPQNVNAEPATRQSSALASRPRRRHEGKAAAGARSRQPGHPRRSAQSRGPTTTRAWRWPSWARPTAPSRRCTRPSSTSRRPTAGGESVAIYGRAHALSQAGRCVEAVQAFAEYARSSARTIRRRRDDGAALRHGLPDAGARRPRPGTRARGVDRRPRRAPVGGCVESVAPSAPPSRHCGSVSRAGPRADRQREPAGRPRRRRSWSGGTRTRSTIATSIPGGGVVVVGAARSRRTDRERRGRRRSRCAAAAPASRRRAERRVARASSQVSTQPPGVGARAGDRLAARQRLRSCRIPPASQRRVTQRPRASDRACASIIAGARSQRAASARARAGERGAAQPLLDRLAQVLLDALPASRRAARRNASAARTRSASHSAGTARTRRPDDERRKQARQLVEVPFDPGVDDVARRRAAGRSTETGSADPAS